MRFLCRCLKDMMRGIYTPNMNSPARVPIGAKCRECMPKKTSVCKTGKHPICTSFS